MHSRKQLWLTSVTKHPLMKAGPICTFGPRRLGPCALTSQRLRLKDGDMTAQPPSAPTAPAFEGGVVDGRVTVTSIARHERKVYSASETAENALDRNLPVLRDCGPGARNQSISDSEFPHDS